MKRKKPIIASPAGVLNEIQHGHRKEKPRQHRHGRRSNARTHPTTSQLPKSSWITPQGHHQVVAFDAVLLEKSKGLAKRKDAVLAVELVIQVGNQTDWRELPTAEHPHGKPKSGSSAKLNALVAGVKAAAIAEFGKERIISVDLHTDESTPRAPRFRTYSRGKLQAKHWLDGAATCAQLRERIHSHVNKAIPCDYEKGAPGGAHTTPAKRRAVQMHPSRNPVLLKKRRIS